ncbi:hypothetical protein [Steroidobacter sp.]|uniref:hypothetical protein n=1 Tax=Steroidobacter sp. TaxID=1978227 RepID=UPI002ED8CD70
MRPVQASMCHCIFPKANIVGILRSQHDRPIVTNNDMPGTNRDGRCRTMSPVGRSSARLTRAAQSGIAQVLLLVLIAVCSANAPVLAQSTDEEIAQLKAEIERLKVEKERLELQAYILAKQNELTTSRAESELAEVKARAEVEKAIADASKGKASAEIDREFLLFDKLKNVDFSNLGVAGDFTAATGIPPSLRAKVQAELALEQAIQDLCTSDSIRQVIETKTPGTAPRIIIDDGGVMLADIAAGVLAFEQLKFSKDALERLTGVSMDAAVGGALAAIQGLGLLSSATRLFRTDTQAAAEDATFDVSYTIQPLTEKYCKGSEVLRAKHLTIGDQLKGETDKIRTTIQDLQTALRQAQEDQQSRQASLTELRKDPKKKDQVALIERQEREAAAVIEQALTVQKSLNPEAINNMAFALHAKSILEQPTTLLLHVQVRGEARRVVKKNAWTSAKAFATGSAHVRMTVRKASGELCATSARYVDAAPVDIVKLAAGTVPLDLAQTKLKADSQSQPAAHPKDVAKAP